MTHYVVTGGAGLVGSHVVDRLLEDEDATVVVVDDFSRGRRENLEAAERTGRLEVVAGDIRDRRLLDGAITGAEVVFHQAALRITQCAEQPRLAMDVLVNGSYEVIEAAVEAGVRKVVAASSASVYGLADQFPTPEGHHPYNDDSLYGAAKTFLEGLLRSFRSTDSLEFAALRYFNVYGPRMDVNGAYTEVLIRWLERIDEGLPLLVFGDGGTTMDFVFADDVARANLLAAAPGGPSGVFNVGSGRETSLDELAATLLRLTGSEVGVERNPSRAVNAVPRRLADVGRARELLGFSAEVSLEDGLRRLLQWWRSQTRTAVHA